MNKHFTFIANYDNFDNLKRLVESLTEKDWKSFTKRKTIASENVYTIPLIYPRKSVQNSLHQHLNSFIEHIKLVEQLVGMEVQRGILVNLPAHQEIRRHMDRGEFLQSTHRIHLPVITNSKCLFSIGDEEMVIPAGQLWEVNNTGEYHNVKNDGDFDRIHLIVDVK